MSMADNPPSHGFAENRRSDDESIAYLDQALWRRLADADTDEEFCYSWLALQCRLISHIQSGAVIFGDPGGSFSPVAFWPKGLSDPEKFAEITQRVLKEQKGVLLKSEPFFHLAYPIKVFGQLHGAVALALGTCPKDHLQSAMRWLQWGVAWLENWIMRKKAGDESHVRDRITTALDLAAITLQEERFQAAATSFVTVLATRLECDRVSVGFKKGNHVKVCALSHSAQFKKQMNLVRSIGAAMDECLGQHSILVYPGSGEGESYILRAHQELAKQDGDSALCTIPFIDNDGLGYGALTLERSSDKPFDAETVELCDSATALIAPILEVKRSNDRLLIKKIGESSRKQLEKLTGRDHIAVKLITSVLLLLVIFFTFAKGDYRVKADTTIEGKIQRALVAPYDGFIYHAYVRAGDTVEEGEVMCDLDDRDFRLERMNWASQREQHMGQYREAMAEGDRANMNILKEKINQAEARLALLDEQLARAELRAPFAGIVVSGDLSQSLGSPVQRGEVLFEITPLHEYRVMLQVDEREISQMKVGQTGDLVLNSFPETHSPITVNKITPVSTAKEGRNYFLVEAKLEEISERLRPGMEGIGKVHIDSRRLIWIWTHDMIDWVRLWAWSWWP